MGLCKTCSELAKRNDDPRPKVAVLGAGIAGLTAAHELAERGFAVDVFEGATEVGGLAASQKHISPRIFGKAARDNHLPGEHGFRAFYSFYRHLTDTMERIPLWDRLPVGELRQDKRRPDGSPRSVAGNLIPTYKVAVALEDNVFREIEYDRRQPRSAAAASYALGVWMVAMGFPSSDIVRLMIRLLQFLTSCRERRYHELTGISLMDYLDAKRLSRRFREKFQNISRFLVAIDPSDGDALTQAMIMCRLLMDPVVSGEAQRNVDRVLNGPTTERWLDPWHFFLQKQDVRFFFEQRLQRFALRRGRLDDAQLRCHTTLKRGEPPCDNGSQRGYWLNTGKPIKGPSRYQYFVSAIPGDVLSRVLGRSPGVVEADRLETARRVTYATSTAEKYSDESFMGLDPDERRAAWLKRARSLALKVTGDPSLGDWVKLVPGAAQRGRRKKEKANYHPWMSGIQFYLYDNVTVLPGHIHFPDSKWALTAVCQSQFWGGDFYWNYGKGKVRSIISVDICDFEAPGQFVKHPNGKGKTALQCSSNEIAAEVWYQLREGLKAWDMVLPEPFPRRSKNPSRILRQRCLDEDLAANVHSMEVKGKPSPVPLPYLDHHIDDRIIFNRGRINRRKTFVQYFVPGKDSWKARPGPLPPLESWDQGYRLRLGRLVIVGHFAQTFTSINTMEAANESGRHGVNAILADYERVIGGKQSRYVHLERCTIWPLEADEPANMDFWKQIDRNLFWDDVNHRPKQGEDGKPPGHLFEALQLDAWLSAMLPHVKSIDNAKFKHGKLWDSDGWKRFEKGFGGMWDKLLTLGRFSSPY